MNKPLKTPNLPKSKVTYAAVSDYSPLLLKKLEELNIKALITQRSNCLSSEICYHSDMLLLNFAEGVVLIDESQKNNIVNYLTMGYRAEFLKNRVMSLYPTDSLLNTVVIGDKIICNPDTADKQILEFAAKADYKLISVNQGYTKCSVCVVNDNAIITDDESIYNACSKKGIDTLYISKGSVKLDGYDYGFIGGCTGLIDKNKLLFNGDINYHKDCNKIIDFLNTYNVYPVIIENEPLYDIGSILPLCEETT